MNREAEKHRVIISRLVLVFILVCLFYRFWINVTPSHFLQPALFQLNLDLLYWLYKYSPIPNLVVYNQTGAVLFDVLLFSSGILSVIFPLKRGFIITFTILFFIYAISYNTFIVHHAHPLAVMMLITFPCWFKKHETWRMAWEGMRYYICYIYVMSFISKTLISNSFFYPQQGIGSAKVNLAEYIYHNPTSVMTSVFYFFLAHPMLLNVGNICIFLLEGLMVAGFFTKKYDRLLLIFPVIIHACTYLFADVFFIEMLVLVFVFFTKKDIEIIAEKFPLLLKH